MHFKVGVIGCGQISDIYLQNCARFDALEVIACASLDLEEAKAKAKKHGIPIACTPQNIFDNPDINAVLNLTIPAAHAQISLDALNFGKHVYSEKPFATSLSDGKKILELSATTNLLVGNAPDTFLGGRWQTCRRLIDEGIIGAPTAVTAFVGTHGTERHHPNPDFYYQEGGGPLLDLGPYYLTAMIFLLGPVARVAGLSRKTFNKRMIENGPRNGEWMKVEIDTHVESLIEFRSGVIGSMTMSFDVWDSETPRLEIYGTEGTICIPDPDPVHGANNFHGPVLFRTRKTSRWTHQPRPPGREDWIVAKNNHGFNENARGLGLLDLAYAVRNNRQPRASAYMAYHVCEVMEGILNAPKLGRYVDIASICDRPEPLPENFPKSEAKHAD
jgi:predicted dehydrogenase